MKRSLTLRAERLAELTAGELTSVAGGATSYQVCVEITGELLCPTVGCTGYYTTLLGPC